MGNIFAGSEIVEIGIQIEKNGRDFYNTLTGQSKNSAASDIFKYLAGEEEKHIAVFQGILSKTEKYEPQGLDADQYYAYMNALASGYVFTQKDKGQEVAKKIKSDKEAVDMGIGFEKDSIIFYEGIKKAVPDYDQKIVDGLIAQEQGHLMQLMDLKAKI
jgi:rubrerythrin